MTRPRVSPHKLAKVAPWEYLLRFVIGGVITAIAGLIARRYGPAFGGMFLAFPAILPASLTLVKYHDGRRQALDDARGGRIATIALAAFALVVTTSATAWPPIVFLPLGTLVWLVVAVAAWRIFRLDRS